jgi:TrmH family RNA methyltransferase
MTIQKSVSGETGRMNPLNNISVLLLETQSAGNIGSVARAMKNLGLHNLVLVNPQTELTDETFALACGADDVIQQAKRFDSLETALSGFALSVGTSSRNVDWIPTVHSPSGIAEQILPMAARQPVALVFGPERTGLTNEHLHFCQRLVTIPTDPAFESMTLSHAVAILAYEIYSRCTAHLQGRGMDIAPWREVEGFLVHLEASLHQIGFLNPVSESRIMRTIRQVFSRASMERRDVRIFRGILRQWSWYVRQSGRGQD